MLQDLEGGDDDLDDLLDELDGIGGNAKAVGTKIGSNSHSNITKMPNLN